MRHRPVRALFVLSVVAAFVALGGAAVAIAPSPGDPVNTITPGATSEPTSTGQPRPEVTKPVSSTDSGTTGTTDSSGVPMWTLPALGLLGLALGVGGGYSLRGRAAPEHAPGPPPAPARRQPPTPAAAPVAPAAPAAGSVLSEDKTDQLIRSVIEARDLAQPDSVLATRLGTALAKAGVTEFAPLGERYDASRHYAVQTTPAPDPAHADLIAEVQRVGYLSGDRVIRPADVVVFRVEPDS